MPARAMAKSTCVPSTQPAEWMDQMVLNTITTSKMAENQPSLIRQPLCGGSTVPLAFVSPNARSVGAAADRSMVMSLNQRRLPPADIPSAMPGVSHLEPLGLCRVGMVRRSGPRAYPVGAPPNPRASKSCACVRRCSAYCPLPTDTVRNGCPCITTLAIIPTDINWSATGCAGSSPPNDTWSSKITDGRRRALTQRRQLA